MYDPQDGGSHTSLTFSADAVEHARPSLRGGASTLEEDLSPLLRRAMDYAKALSDPYLGSLDVDAQVASVTVTTTPSPSLLVQPKGAKPYWRLAQRPPVIEVMAPWGTELGMPEGKIVRMFNATVPGEISRLQLGHIELPVAVASSACAWMGSSGEEADGLDRGLRCALGPEEVVRDVQIRVAQEL